MLVAAMAPATRAPLQSQEAFERRIRGLAIHLMPPDEAPIPGFPRPLSSMEYEKLLDRMGIPFEKRPASLDAQFDRYVDEWRRLRDGELASFDFPFESSFFGTAMPIDQLALGRAAATKLLASQQRLLAAMIEAAPDVDSARIEERIVRREFERSFIRAELGPRFLRGQLVDVQGLVEALVEDRELRAKARAALDAMQPGYDRILEELRDVRVRVEREWTARVGPPPASDAPEEVRQQWWNAQLDAVAAGLTQTFERAAALAAINLKAIERLEAILPSQTWLRLRGRYFQDALAWSGVPSQPWFDPFYMRRNTVERLESEEQARVRALLDAREPEWRRREAVVMRDFVDALERSLNGQNRMDGHDWEKDSAMLAVINDRFIALINETEERLATELGDTPRHHQPTRPNSIGTRSLDRATEGSGGQQRRLSRGRPFEKLEPITRERLEALVALAGGGEVARDLADAIVQETKRLIDEYQQSARGHGDEVPPTERQRRAEERRNLARALWDEVDRLEEALFEGLAAGATPESRPRIERAAQSRRIERLLAVEGSGWGSPPLHAFAWSEIHAIDLAQVIAQTPLSEDSRLRLEPLVGAYVAEALTTLDRRRHELPAALTDYGRLYERSRAAGRESPEGMQAARDTGAAGDRLRDVERSLGPLNRRWIAAFLEAMSVSTDRDALQMALWRHEWPGVFHNSTLTYDVLANLRSRPDLTDDDRTALARIEESLRRQLMPVERESAEILLTGADSPARREPPQLRAQRHRRLDRLAWDRAEIAASVLRTIARTFPERWPDLRPNSPRPPGVQYGIGLER